MKKILSVIIVLAIMFPSTIMASAVTEVAKKDDFVSAQYVESVKESTLEIEEYTEGLNSVVSIENIEALKMSIKDNHPKMTDYQIGRAVLMSLGDDEAFVNQLPEEKVLEAAGYISAEVSIAYLVEGKDGELIQVSKADFESDGTQVSTQAGIATNSLPDYSETHGKLILKSTAYKMNPSYALPGRTYYAIRGEVQWTSRPNYLYRDILAISSTGNIDNNYDHFAYGVWKHPSLGTTITSTTHLNGSTGPYLTVSTPSLYGIGATFYLGTGQMQQIIIQNLYMYYGVSCQLDITCQVAYAHAKPTWSPSLSISSSGAISFGSLSIIGQTFYGTAFTLYH